MREAAMFKVLQQLKEWQQRVKGVGGGSLSDLGSENKEEMLVREREMSVRVHVLSFPTGPFSTCFIKPWQ